MNLNKNIFKHRDEIEIKCYYFQLSLGTRSFVVISRQECPCFRKDDRSDCKRLPECSNNMKNNDLCQADQALPDGNTYFDVNNCFGYDVFQYVEGKSNFFIEL